MIKEPIETALERSESNQEPWTLCDICKEGVLLNEAGFDVEMHLCNMCCNHVADREEFFKFNDGVRALSK